MWKRHTFHDCAKELRTTSHQFRSASLALKNGAGGGHSEQAEAASREGTSILRTLALAVRSEQDYGLASLPGIDVGALREEASEYEARAILNEYRPPVSDLAGYEPLRLREALNKIAHADPRGASFFVDEDVHDLILTGARRGRTWIAIISIPRLCDAVESIPDEELPFELRK